MARTGEKWGETPCAFVEPKPAASASKAEILAWCRGLLARYKCPRYVVFGKLPKTSTGKVRKFELRERARGGVTLPRDGGNPASTQNFATITPWLCLFNVLVLCFDRHT